MTEPWQEFLDEVERSRDAGVAVEFWWRDDDASRETPELTRLLVLAQDSGLPLALAVIPHLVQAQAFVPWPSNASVLQHGLEHVNRASAKQKKSEFPESEAGQAALARLWQGQALLRETLAVPVLPVLAPPWNRFPASWAGALAAQGYRGLSTFTPRRQAFPVEGLIQVNTHIDIVDWRNGKVFVGERQALALACEQIQLRRSGVLDHKEPIGWLTHHAVQQEASWTFLTRLFQATKELPGLRWLEPVEVFAMGST